MPQISLAKAELLALFLECVLYGAFMILYVVTMLIWFGRRGKKSDYRRIGAPVATAMAIMATAHLIIDFCRIIEAFITQVDNFSDGANGYYAVLNNPLEVAKTVVYATQTIMGDTVMIWRLSVVYNRTLFVTIPMGIVLLVNIVIGYLIAWVLSQAKPGVDIFATARAYITTFFVLTLFINITATIGIVFRIVSHNYSLSKLRLSKTSHLMPVAIIVVESGAIYASSVLALLITYLSGTNGQYPALDVITPLVGIVFCLIVLQLHFRLDSEGMMAAPSSHGTGTMPPRSDYPLQPLSIHVTHAQNVDSDDFLGQDLKPSQPF